MLAAHWLTNSCSLAYSVGCSLAYSVGCSLAYWCQLLICHLISASHWPTEFSRSLANWCQAFIGQMMKGVHWPNDISCLLAKWCQLFIGQLMLAKNHCTTDISCLSAPALKNLFRHILYFNTLDKTGIATLLVDEDDIKRDITAAQRPSDICWSLANWCQLLIGQLMSAAHWPTDD